jgi:hypothetical protein
MTIFGFGIFVDALKPEVNTALSLSATMPA